MTISLNEICNPSAWDEASFLKYFDELQIPKDKNIMHRKHWEWAQALYGLDRLGFLKNTLTALDVGAGKEHIMYYLANKLKKIIGIDLYNEEPKDDIHNTAPTDMLINPEKYAPFPYTKENLEIIRMDGRNLEFADSTFDIVVSMSSIEHFGGHEGSMKCMQEIGRVLKHGGIASIVTECILNDQKHPEYFTPDELKSFLIKPSKLELIEPIKFQQPFLESYLKKPLKLPEEAENIFPHFVLDSDGTIFTSVMMFLRKP